MSQIVYCYGYGTLDMCNMHGVCALESSSFKQYHRQYTISTMYKVLHNILQMSWLLPLCIMYMY